MNWETLLDWAGTIFVVCVAIGYVFHEFIGPWLGKKISH